MLTFTMISDPANYRDARYNYILGLEEGGKPKLDPYVDQGGIPHIGVGFNLQTPAGNQDTIFAALNITNQALRLELQGIFDTKYSGGSQADRNSRVRKDIKNALVKYKYSAGAFHFADEAAVRTVFEQIVGFKENSIDSWAGKILGVIP